MRDQARALQLVEQIYQALVEPDGWAGFLESLSEELGGAAVQFSLRLPDEAPTPADYYSFGLDPSYRGVFIKLVLEGLPWGSLDHAAFRGHFGRASEVVTDHEIGDSALYLDFMRPQDLACEWPICHLVATQNGRPMSGVVIYQREGGRSLDADDMAMLDSLVPHLARAYAIHCRLRQTRQELDALNEAVNRLPTGVMLLDADARVVMGNRSADQILAQDDGLSLRGGKPHLVDERENRELHEKIRVCAREQQASGSSLGEVMLVSRPSGRRPMSMLVSPLLAALPGSLTNEARVIVFVTTPDGNQISATAILQSLYQLTQAEADLVRLIAEGRSLDAVAEERGVTMNTVRSQLKQVFSKTDTNRQSELVHLVLAGVARIHHHDEKPEGSSS